MKINKRLPQLFTIFVFGLIIADVNFTVFNAPLIAEIIDNSCDEEESGDAEKRNFEDAGLSGDNQVGNGQAGYQEIHGRPEKRQKGSLVSQVGALYGQLLAKNKLFFYSSIWCIFHKSVLRIMSAGYRPVLCSEFRI